MFRLLRLHSPLSEISLRQRPHLILQTRSIASSLPPQIPGRPELDATTRANELDHLVSQKRKDKIWAQEYVELSTLLQEEDQEKELQISSHSANNKKEVNMIAK